MRVTIGGFAVAKPAQSFNHRVLRLDCRASMTL